MMRQKRIAIVQENGTEILEKTVNKRLKVLQDEGNEVLYVKLVTNVYMVGDEAKTKEIVYIVHLTKK